MKLADVQKNIDDYSKSASDIVRQLALAGIAMIWLFKTGKPESAGIPFSDVLLAPLAGFALGLILDLLQYVFSALSWYVFFRRVDRSGTTRDSEVGGAPKWVNWPNMLCFFGKIAVVALAYLLLLAYIVSLL